MTPAEVDPTLSIALKIGSGFFWTAAYILIIRRGWKDRTYGMPLAALGANLAWEFIFSFVLPHQPPQLQVNRVWLLFDLGLLWQTLRFGRERQVHPWLRKNFYALLGAAVVGGFFAVYTITLEFSDWGGMYAAFGQNLMMSLLFIGLAINRENAQGQSLWIAAAKMIGTVLPSILFHLTYPRSPLLNFLFIAIFLADLLYLVLLRRRLLAAGMPTWRRA